MAKLKITGASRSLDNITAEGNQTAADTSLTTPYYTISKTFGANESYTLPYSGKVNITAATGTSGTNPNISNYVYITDSITGVETSYKITTTSATALFPEYLELKKGTGIRTYSSNTASLWATRAWLTLNIKEGYR